MFLVLRVDLPVIVVITAQRHFTLNTEKNQTMSYFFSLGKCVRNLGLKQAGLAQNQQKHSNQAVSLTIYSPFTSENSLL